MKKIRFRCLLTATTLLCAATVLATACGAATKAASTSEPTASATSGEIVVSGLVAYPMTFMKADLDYMDWITETATGPGSESNSYQGVRLPDVWSFFGVKPAAKTVVVTGGDGSKTEVALSDVSVEALLSLAENDSFSLVMPGMREAAWVKDVVALEFK